MAIRISLAGAVLAGCLGLAGCVTEPGKTGPALWTSIDTKSEPSDVHLKNPVRLHASYGRMAEANGRPKVAREHYEAALSQDPKCVDAIVGIARLDQVAGRTRRAEMGLRTALKLAPKNADVLQSAGLFYSSQGRWREAVASLKAAVAAEPNVGKHRYALAAVLAKSGDVNAALPHFVATVGRAEAHSQIARYLFERGDRDGAEQQIRIALSLKPQLSSARRMVAQLRGNDQRRALATAQDGTAGPRSRVAAEYDAAAHPSRAAAEPQRGPVRSVSHVSPANGLGSQTAWRREPPQQTGQRPYADRRSEPQRYDRRYVPPRDDRPLQIVPQTNGVQQDGPMIQPRGQAGNDRFRRPLPIDRGGYDDNSYRPLPQWDPHGRNR